MIHQITAMHIKSFNRALNIFVIFLSAWLIANAFIKFYLSKTLSFESFILVTSFFSICLFWSFLSFLKKISTFEEIIKGNDRKLGDILAGFSGLVIGMIGIYIGIFFEIEKIEKIISVASGLFFLVLAGTYLAIKFSKK